METKKIIKIEVTKNYIIEDYKNPPNVIKYVKKEIEDKNGFRNLATLAIIKDPKTGETKTVITSFWRPINKPSAKRLLKYYLKNYPNKVKFSNQEVKEKYLNESFLSNSRSVTTFLYENSYAWHHK
jgi:hypothetical protein